MTEQQEHKTVRISEITPEILENINVGDWIEGIGDVGCYYDRKIIRVIGAWLRRFVPSEKADVHWIAGAELREIYADDLSLDKYDEIRKRPATPVKEQIVAAEKRGYERALDDLGVLHGEDARKFNEELENPSPLTPEAAEVMREAWELARK